MKKLLIIICLVLSILITGCGKQVKTVSKEKQIKLIEETFEGTEGKLSLNDQLIEYIYQYIQTNNQDPSLSDCFYHYMIEKTVPEIRGPVKNCQENVPEGLQLLYWIDVDQEKELESYSVYISNGSKLSNARFEYKVLKGEWMISTYDLPVLDYVLTSDQFYEFGKSFMSAFTQGIDTKEAMHQFIADLQEHDYSFGEDYYVFVNSYQNENNEEVQYLAITPQNLSK